MSTTTAAMSSSTPPAKQSPDRSGSDRGFPIGKYLESYALPLALIVLLVWFSASPTISNMFTAPANINNLLANQAVTGLVAIAMVVPLVTGKFDLSIPAGAGLANVATAALIATHGLPIWVGMAGGLIIGTLVGAINGILVAVLKLNPFIATLGVYVFIQGLLQFYTRGQVISAGMPSAVGEWGSAKWIGIPRPFWMLVVVAIVVWWVLAQIPFGRKLYAIGSNESAARLAGIRVGRSVFLAFLTGGCIAGLAGILLTIRAAGADGNAGPSYLFPAIAAVFLGQTAIKPGMSNVWGTVIGVFFVAVAVNGFTLLGANAWVTQVFNGGSLVVAVAASTLMAKARERRARAIQIAGLHHDGPDRDSSVAATQGRPERKTGATTNNTET